MQSGGLAGIGGMKQMGGQQQQQQMGGQQGAPLSSVFVKDLEPNMKNINLNVIVLDIGKPSQTKDGHEVRNIRVADKTGSVNLSLWNEFGAVLREGDILRLSGCFTQIWKNSLQVKVGNKGMINKTGEFNMIFSELPDMSLLSPEMMKEIQEQQQGSNSMNKPPFSSTQTATNQPLLTNRPPPNIK